MRKTYIIMLFVVLEILLLLVVNHEKEAHLQEEAMHRLEQVQSSVTSAQYGHRKIAQMIFRGSIDLPANLALMAEAYDNPGKRDANRVKLLKNVEPILNDLRSLGLQQIQFHFPPATSFLRIHRPDMYGDDLSKVRHVVVLTNNTKAFQEGFEVGRMFSGYRYVFPLFYQDKHIGSVELGIATDAVQEYMNQSFRGLFRIFIVSQKAQDVVWPESKRFYDVSFLSDRLMLEKGQAYADSGINEAELQKLNRKLHDQYGTRLDRMDEFAVVTRMGDLDMVVSFLPVRDTSGEKVAYVVNYMPDDSIALIRKAAESRMVAWTVILVLVCSILYLMRLNHLRTMELNQMLSRQVSEGADVIRMQEEMMVQNAKLATQGQLIGSIAHQWRQPLSALAVMVREVEDRHEFNELDLQGMRKFADDAMSQINLMSDTITDFMQFMRPDTEMATFRVTDSVNLVVKMLTAQLKSKTVFMSVSGMEGEIPCVRGYPNEFRHVLINLILNARDAIVSRRDDIQFFEGIVHIAVRHAGGKVTVVVSDNGGGIPEGMKEEIFKPYVSTKGEKGNGLGLHIAQLVVEHRMSGTITAENSLDGARFTIQIPAVPCDLKKEEEIC